MFSIIVWWMIKQKIQLFQSNMTKISIPNTRSGGARNPPFVWRGTVLACLALSMSSPLWPWPLSVDPPSVDVHSVCSTAARGEVLPDTHAWKVGRVVSLLVARGVAVACVDQQRNYSRDKNVAPCTRAHDTERHTEKRNEKRNHNANDNV